MTSVFKTLFEGQLSNSITVLATVPGGKSWLVKHISCVNSDIVNTHTMSLYRNGNTGAKLMTPPEVLLPIGGMFEFTGTLALEAGATISGKADGASKVTIIIDGDEIT